MARPTFIPDRAQARLMRALGRHHERIQTADADFTLAIKQAKDAGVPIEQIAKAAGVTVKTVYARLARTGDTDQGPWKPPWQT